MLQLRTVKGSDVSWRGRQREWSRRLRLLWMRWPSTSAPDNRREEANSRRQSKRKPEDLRKPFAQFGPLKDIYLPRDYHSGDPRGFGFVQYVDPADAAEAKYQMDGQILLGRELTVVYAEENRKKPGEMRARERVSSRSRTYGHRISPRFSHSRSPPRRSTRYSRSRSPSYHSQSPKHGRRSRSVTPEDRRNRRERSYSQSPYPAGSGSRSPPEDNDNAREVYRRERSRSLSQ